MSNSKTMSKGSSAKQLPQERRLDILDFICQEAHKTYEHKKEQLHSKINASNLLLISWTLIFSGIVGLLQAGVLQASNTQSILIMLSVMTLSVTLCIVSVINPKNEESAPNVERLYKEYCDAVENYSTDQDKLISLKEKATGSLIKARATSQNKLEQKSKMLRPAFILFLVELMLLLTYILFPNLMIQFIV